MPFLLNLSFLFFFPFFVFYFSKLINFSQNYSRFNKYTSVIIMYVESLNCFNLIHFVSHRRLSYDCVFLIGILSLWVTQIEREKKIQEDKENSEAYLFRINRGNPLSIVFFLFQINKNTYIDTSYSAADWFSVKIFARKPYV